MTDTDTLIAAMSPKAVAIVERLARDTTYTAREIYAFRIVGSVSLLHVSAVIDRLNERD